MGRQRDTGLPVRPATWRQSVTPTAALPAALRRGLGLVVRARPASIAIAVAVAVVAWGITGTGVAGSGRPHARATVIVPASSPTSTTPATPVTTTTDSPAAAATPDSATPGLPSSGAPAAVPVASGRAPAVGSTIQAVGTHLVLSGSTYRFLGVNAYEAATQWGTNAGCGAMLTDAQLDQLFSSLAPNSLVRIWAFQGSMAINVHTGQLDWGPLDRVFAAAAAHGQRLIAALTDQGGTCDGDHWQDPSWYLGGFRSADDAPSRTGGSGLTPLSYWDYLQAVVSRYAASPALGMWEPISEAEASTCPPQDEPADCGGHQTCPDESAAAEALRSFFDTVGGEIHTLDPRHLVESGLLGGGQCGTRGADYQYVSASPGIDVLSYHDYYGEAAMGGDRWNGVAVRLGQAAALGKPVIGGEVGMNAGTAPGCPSLTGRSGSFRAKVEAQLGAGSSGLLEWDWVPAPSSSCTSDVGPGDPLLMTARAGAA